MNLGKLNSSDDFRAYIYQVILACGIICAILIGFNWIVNPYGVWRSPRFHHFNEFIDVTQHERLYKMIQVAHQGGTEVLLVGSSVVKKPMYPELYEKITGLKTYNSGIDGARVSELRQIVEQAVIFEPNLKEIILALNYYMFNEKSTAAKKEFPQGQVGWSFPVGERLPATILSRDALFESVKVVWENARGKIKFSAIDEDGKMNPQRLQAEYKSCKNMEQFGMETQGQMKMFKAFSLSKPALEDFSAIVRLCEERDIALKVYINPVHGIFLESIYEAGGGKKFEEWKKALVAIHPIYDFAQFCKVGSEPFSLTRRYFRHSEHPMPVTGEMVMKKLAEKPLPKDIEPFGVLLTTENVEEYLEANRRARTEWRKAHPDMLKCVQGLVKKYGG